MAKNDYYLKHAQHNEKVCQHLSLNQEFTDWVITTAFYSALHYISYKVFPFTIPSSNGEPSITVNSIDQYYNTPSGSSKNLSKHQLLAKLADLHCSPICEDYRWLLDMSMNARYSNYQHMVQVSQRAMSLLTKIKKHCSK